MKDKINIMKMPDPITRRFLKKKFFYTVFKQIIAMVIPREEMDKKYQSSG